MLALTCGSPSSLSEYESPTIGLKFLAFSYAAVDCRFELEFPVPLGVLVKIVF